MLVKLTKTEEMKEMMEGLWFTTFTEPGLGSDLDEREVIPEPMRKKMHDFFIENPPELPIHPNFPLPLSVTQQLPPALKHKFALHIVQWLCYVETARIDSLHGVLVPEKFPDLMSFPSFYLYNAYLHPDTLKLIAAGEVRFEIVENS